MLFGKFIKNWFIAFTLLMLTGCLGASITAPKIPDKLNKPSRVTIKKINGVNVGLPKGWKNVKKIPRNYKETGGVVYLKHRKYGNIIIFKSPALSDARYGQIFTRTLKDTIMPNAKAYSGSISLNNDAIVEIFKGSIVVEGERFPMRVYGAYNISNGLGGKYYMHASVTEKNATIKYFYDFIAIAGSL